MKICGFQKLTLLDYPGHVAATVFTGGCNYRCPFCHNSELISLDKIKTENMFSEEEILKVLKKRAGVLEGVCITGGEPTLQPDLGDFIKKIREMGYKIKLDTNGYRPEVLKSLCHEGLIDYVAMDIKSSREHYGNVAGVPTLQISRIEESAAFLMGGSIPYEFRTTVVPELHAEEDFSSIGQWLHGNSPYYLQAYRDSEQVLERRFSQPTAELMNQIREILLPYLPNTQLRGIDQ